MIGNNIVLNNLYGFCSEQATIFTDFHQIRACQNVIGYNLLLNLLMSLHIKYFQNNARSGEQSVTWFWVISHFNHFIIWYVCTFFIYILDYTISKLTDEWLLKLCCMASVKFIWINKHSNSPNIQQITTTATKNTE